MNVSEVSVGYNAQSVARVTDSLAFPCDGTMSLLVGRNGAGKSTFLKTLCGLLPPVGDGQVSPVASIYLSEDVSFPGELSARALFRTLLGDRFSEAMVHANMLEIDTGKVYQQLSKGNRQKVNIVLTEGLAVRNQSELILYDEPLNGVDWPTASMLLSLFQGEIGKFSRKTHRLIAMHPHAINEGLFSQVIVVERGEIRQGRLSEYRDLQESFTLALR